jgi:hypothetical protein
MSATLSNVSPTFRGIVQRGQQTDRDDRDDQDVLHEPLSRLVLHEARPRLLHGFPLALPAGCVGWAPGEQLRGLWVGPSWSTRPHDGDHTGAPVRALLSIQTARRAGPILKLLCVNHLADRPGRDSRGMSRGTTVRRVPSRYIPRHARRPDPSIPRRSRARRMAPAVTPPKTKGPQPQLKPRRSARAGPRLTRIPRSGRVSR